MHHRALAPVLPYVRKASTTSGGVSVSDFDGGMGSTNEEQLDFTGDVFKPSEKTWTITDASIDAVEDNGEAIGKQLVVVLEAEDGFTRTEKYWLEHAIVDGKDWPQAVKIARGNAADLAVAALGTPSIVASRLIGQKVNGWLSKDSNGFFRLGRFKSAPKEVQPVL